MKNLVAFILLAPSVALATPAITSLSGTPGAGNTITITGTALGSHPSGLSGQKPTVFTDFEDGDVAPDEGYGILTSWTDSNCMSTTTATTAEGTYAVYADVSDTCQVEARLQIGVSFSANGNIVASVHRRNDNDANHSENWKYWRIAETGGGNIYPNFYIGEAADSGPQAYTETCNTSTHRKYFGYASPDTTWMEDSLFLYKGTADENNTGYFKSRQDGTITGSSTTYSFNCGLDSAAMNEFNIQDDLSNDRESNGENIYYDWVYIDTVTANYFMLTNASTLASSTKLWIQPYTKMTTTEAQITLKYADLGSDASSIYVYACVDGNDCSSGVQLSSSSSGASPKIRNVLWNDGTTE